VIFRCKVLTDSTITSIQSHCAGFQAHTYTLAVSLSCSLYAHCVCCTHTHTHMHADKSFTHELKSMLGQLLHNSYFQRDNHVLKCRGKSSQMNCTAFTQGVFQLQSSISTVGEEKGGAPLRNCFWVHFYDVLCVQVESCGNVKTI